MAFFGQASPASAPGAPGQIRASMNKFPPNPDTAALGAGAGRMAGRQPGQVPLMQGGELQGYVTPGAAPGPRTPLPMGGDMQQAPQDPYDPAYRAAYGLGAIARPVAGQKGFEQWGDGGNKGVANLGGATTGDGPMNGGGLMSNWTGLGNAMQTIPGSRPQPTVGQPGYNQFDPAMNPLAATPNGQGGGYNGPAPDGSTGANRPGMQYRADRRAGQPGKQGGPGAPMPTPALNPSVRGPIGL